MRIKPFTRRGDTLIEVSFAITVFSIVSVLAVGLMNSSLANAQANLEVTMARNEMDAQADAIRFIQNSYAADRAYIDSAQPYRELWLRLIGFANSLSTNFNELQDVAGGKDSCAKTFYGGDSGNSRPENAFIINTRKIDTEGTNGAKNTIIDEDGKFQSATLYPRIFYNSFSDTDNDTLYEVIDIEDDAENTTLASAEGIWVLAAKGVGDDSNDNDAPEFYDFHIRTCWYSPGKTYPTTIATVIRLYNPDYFEGEGGA